MPTILPGVLGVLLAVATASATGDDAEVIAQHIVTLDEGLYHWVVAPVAVEVEPSSGTTEAPSFFVAVAGTATLADRTGAAQYELDTGEATVVLPGEEYTYSAAVADPPAELWRIELAAGDASGAPGDVGAAFVTGPGEHDLELVRDILSPSELLALPTSAASTLVHTTGDVIVTSDATSLATELGAGRVQVFSGALTIANLGEEAVAVLATRITPTIGTAGAGTPVESSSPADSTIAGAAPPTTTTATSTAPSSPSSSTPASSTPAPPSTTAPGTTPAVPDDTLDPGAVNTSPSSFRDSDGDGLTDADEAPYGTNPHRSDTDEDLWSDGDEVAAGTDPLALSDRPYVDSDGDGFDETTEYYAHTDPNEPLSHP